MFVIYCYCQSESLFVLHVYSALVSFSVSVVSFFHRLKIPFACFFVFKIYVFNRKEKKKQTVYSFTWCQPSIFLTSYVQLNVVRIFGYLIIRQVKVCSCLSMSFLFCLSELNIRFTQKLVGQPLVHKLVLNSITSHLTNPNPSKALVLSLHGSTGTGLSMNFRFIFNVFFFSREKFCC